MSIKVSDHIHIQNRSDKYGYSNSIGHPNVEGGREPRNLKLFDVYTSNEVKTMINEVQIMIKAEVLKLSKSLGSTNNKVDNSLQKIHEAIGDIPQMIINDEVFRTSIKNEILEEIRRELGSNP